MRSPHSGSLEQFAGLMWTLVRTDFKTRYHGTLQGFAWALLKPVLMFLVLLGVFSFIFAREPGYQLNLIIGLFLWEFFAQGTSVGLTSLATKGFLLSKARFPAWIIVVTSLSNALITLAAFSLIVFVAMSITGHMPSPLGFALFLGYMVHFAAIVIGFSLASSVLFLRYRDLNQVWEVVLQAGFFVAPIIYPLSIMPEHLHKYLYVWPPTPVIQFSRMVLTTGEVPTLQAHLFLTIEALVALLVGVAVFRRYVSHVAERL
jgi:lipopolysaccharide transport system permease protein